MLLGLETRNPFRLRPSYEAIAHLPVDQRIVAMRDPQVRAAILAEEPVNDDETKMLGQKGLEMVLPRCYVLESGVEPDYEQDPSRSLGALAQARGTTPMEIAYDALTASDDPTMLLLQIGRAHV